MKQIVYGAVYFFALFAVAQSVKHFAAFSAGNYEVRAFEQFQMMRDCRT